jgi:DNA-directed RNA polymerase subunit RPC12/RpoP
MATHKCKNCSGKIFPERETECSYCGSSFVVKKIKLKKLEEHKRPKLTWKQELAILFLGLFFAVYIIHMFKKGRK